VSEAAVAHDESKGGEPDFALADMFMSVHARTAGSFGIVQMNCREVSQPDYAMEFAKHFSNRRFASDIVTGRKNMRSIKADTQPPRFTHAADDVREMFKPISEA
jgi:hypothetical protein